MLNLILLIVEFHKLAGTFFAFLSLFAVWWKMRKSFVDEGKFWEYSNVELARCEKFMSEFRDEWSWKDCKKYSRIAEVLEAGKMDTLKDEDLAWYNEKTGERLKKKLQRKKPPKKERKDSFEWEGSYNQNEFNNEFKTS